MRQCSIMLWRPLVVVAALLVAVSWAQETLVWQDEFDWLNENNWNHLIGGFRGWNQEFEYYRNNRQNRLQKDGPTGLTANISYVEALSLVNYVTSIAKRKTASYVRDGVLYIRPTFTADEYGEGFLTTGTISDPACNTSPCESAAGQDIVLPIQSARITTTNSFGMLYGRLVIRAKMPHGDWIWPALWLMPTESVYGQWPRSGEIDLVETRGNRHLVDWNGLTQGVDSIGSTMHWGPDTGHNGFAQTHWEMRGTDYANDFHEYQLEWSPQCMKFSVDGQTIGSVPAPEGGFWHKGGFDQNPGGENIWANGGAMAPFDRKFYIMFNVAVGGSYFNDGFTNSPNPRPWNWDSPHPMKDFWDNRSWWISTWEGEDAAMKVDYVRVYDQNNPVTC